MARTEGLWQIENGSLVPAEGTEQDIRLPGPDAYINFGTNTGSPGYGFRDNNGQIEVKDSGGSWVDITTGLGGTASGSDGQIQYNDGGAFGGASDFYYNDATGNVGIGTNSPNHTLDVDGNIGLTVGSYINWGSTSGSGGYGIRDNGGNLEFKDSGGSWTDFGSGGGSGATQLSELSDVSSVTYTAGQVLRANGSEYVSAQLQHSDLTSINSDDHHTKYTDEEAQDAVGTIMTGSGATSVTYDDAGNTITISSTDTDTQLSDEQVQDAVYNNVLSGTQTLISVTYDDANNEVDYVVDNDLSNYDNSTSGFLTDITGENLTNLSDVDTDKLQAPADGDVLTYDGTDWQAETPSAGVDVNGTPTAGNLAQFVDSDTIEDAGTSIASGTINQDDIYVGNASNEMVATDPSTYSASNFDISTLDTDIESQINSQSSTGTLTPDLSSATKYYITALAGSLTVAAPTNATQGDTIVIVISDDGTSRSISYNSTYVAMGASLPTSTTTGKRTELIAHYDGTDWLTSSTVEQ